MKNCDEHVVGISYKYMQHNEKMIAKYVLTFGLDDTGNLLPLQKDESHTQEKGSMFYYIQIQQKKICQRINNGKLSLSKSYNF
jgi:hypothetical protein